MQFLYPKLSIWIEKLPIRFGKILCKLLIIFMVFDSLFSAAALARYEDRQKMRAVEAEDASWFKEFLDVHFDDERMERIYPNAKIVNK